LLPGDLFALQQLSNGKETVCPCDGVLLAGKCVMNEVKLTGESVPQMKDSITALDGAQRLQMDQAVHRPHVLYGGTKLVMVATPAEGEAAMPQTSRIPAGESGACLVYALRTGFGTSQGELMRTILFATNGGGGLNNAETFLFIGVLLVFAVISSAYVMHEGLKDPERSRWKLFLNCTLIITSVIPPELPMELSLAVNTSLAALMRKGRPFILLPRIWCPRLTSLLRPAGIFCTEPFRIPLAGKVDICCFDKTGTLTSDKMVVHGVAGLAFPKDEPEDVEGSQESNASPPLIQPTAVPIETSTILAACNSLVLVKQNVFGDPLERVALDAVGWRLGRNDKFELKPQKVRASIVARYHFDSSLRRMSVLAAVESSSSIMQSGMYVLAKGAPETMEQLYDPTSVPRDFSSVHHHYSLRGGRVLALGYKQLTSSGTSNWTAVSRTQAESSLIFAGFLVLSCPMKASSLKSVTALRRSSHRVVMITGDNMLTACYVASTLRFFKSKRRALVLHPSPLQWQTVDEDTPVQHPLVLDKKALDALESKFALCISGDSYAAVLDTHSDELERVHAMLPRIKVFARMSPEQKEAVVITLSDLGLTVLMCGDGTNDVGALKQAHVGVGLLEAGDSESGPHGSSHTKAKRASKKSGSLQMLGTYPITARAHYSC
jgi:cation-transporting ATPase 13A1